MYTKSGSSQKKTNTQTSKNPLETLKDFSGSMVKNTASDFKKMGTGIFDQFFGGGYNEQGDQNQEFGNTWEKQKPTSRPKREFSLYNYQEHYEKEIIKKEISQLTDAIKKEVELLKRANSSLLAEVQDVSKLTLNALPEKPGVYHIRFLELILSLLRTLRAKVGESRTWMAAMVSKKKKRGSLFATLSKKKGTQYSLSQELQATRAIQ